MIEKIKNIESKEVPKTVLDYLHDKHSTIKNNYLTPDGQYSESCTLIAIDLAELFLKAGRQPYIMKISEDVHKNGIISLKSLKPIIYKGEVSWGAHQVCCCDDQAFDPIIGTPIPIDEYTKTVFGENINTKISVSKEEIKDFVTR